jgi:predicted nucleic acid-binding protein
MKDILLDTNIISLYVRGKKNGGDRFDLVEQRLTSLGRRNIWIPVMSVMEIECGLSMGEQPNPTPAVLQARADIRAFLGRYQKVRIDSETVPWYALIRSKVFELYAKRKPGGRGYAVRKTHELTERTTDIQLGIDERDLLIVCAAVQRNFCLATFDDKKEMKAILAAVQDLKLQGKINLDVEEWDLPPPKTGP